MTNRPDDGGRDFEITYGVGKHKGATRFPEGCSLRSWHCGLALAASPLASRTSSTSEKEENTTYKNPSSYAGYGLNRF